MFRPLLPLNPNRPRNYHPSLEALEDRTTPATFLVTNSSDTMAPGSLRYAIAQANLDPGSTVLITPQLTGPITLTQGELAISASVTIRNNAAAPVTIHQATRNARVFHVTGSSPLAVTLSGGSPFAPLVLTGGSVRGQNGGGILVDPAGSTLALEFIQVVGNRALRSVNSSQPTGGLGGGVYSASSVSLQASLIAGNSADTGGGGIGVNQGAVTLIQGSSVAGNRSRVGQGGGVSVASGSVSLSGASHVDGNSAKDVGGIMVGTALAFGDTAVSVTGGSTVNGNSSSAGQRQNPTNLGGGGIAVLELGNVTIDAGQVSNNRTVGMYSGGIVVGLGSVTVTNGSLITGNRNNGPGGGIAANFGGKVSVGGQSQVSFNTGGALGGGIVNFAGPLGAVEVSGGSQVSNNTLTNGETIGRVIAVFLAVADPNSGSRQFAVASGGQGGAAMLRDLKRVDRAALRVGRRLAHLLANVSHPLGELVAGGGIATLETPVSITGGSQVAGNFSGKNVLGGRHRVIGVGGGLFHLAGRGLIDQSLIDGNQAPTGEGGGIWNGGRLSITGGSVSRNHARRGGGIFRHGGRLNLDGVVLVGNTPNNIAGR